MSETDSRQLLHLVFGGELTDPARIEYKDLKNLDIVGIFASYEEARQAWQAKAQASVDDANMRYVIVHLHKLLDPDNDGVFG